MKALTCTVKTLVLMSISMALLTGCQSQWTQEPGFGSTVTQAINAQIMNPGAPDNLPPNRTGMDGVAAKSGMDSYQRSFIRANQPGFAGSGSPLGVIAPGGSGGASNGSGSASPLTTMPSN